MSVVIDKRNESSKGRGSRERLIQRTRESAREAINKAIKKGNITDIGKDGTDVIVPRDGLSEPQIVHGEGGITERVLPGNNNEKARFKTGDRLPRPPKGGGGAGNEGSPDGEGEDSFVYHISEQEFLNLLFEDLELPNMFKLGAEDTEQTIIEQAGFSQKGTFNRLSLIRSKMEKAKREIVMNRHTNTRILELLGEEKDIYSQYGALSEGGQVDPRDESLSSKAKIKLLEKEVMELSLFFADQLSLDETKRVGAIHDELAVLNGKKQYVAKWRESSDLRFRAVEELPTPTSKAVMFCEMDVSASMNEDMKSNAKVFFYLLYKFLTRQYDKVDIIFIRHHSTADEVDEKEFFEGKATGGTVVSTAHEKLLEIQQARYPANVWNIYAAQASDGDNFSSDNEKTLGLMKKILPMVQGFFHIEVGDPTYSRGNTDLWQTYQPLRALFKDRFWMEKVKARKDVWPVFRELFKKREGGTRSLQPKTSAQTLGYGE